MHDGELVALMATHKTTDGGLVDFKIAKTFSAINEKRGQMKQKRKLLKLPF